MTKIAVQIYEIQDPGEAEAVIGLGVDRIGSVILSEENWKIPAIREVILISRGARVKHSLITLFDTKEVLFQAIEFYTPDIIHFCESLTYSHGRIMPCEALVELQICIKERFPEIEIMRSVPIAAQENNEASPPSRAGVLPYGSDSQPGKEDRHFCIAPLDPALPGGACGEHAGQRIPTLEIARCFEATSDYFLVDTSTGSEPVEGYIGITGRTGDWAVARELVKSSPVPIILAGGLSPENVYEAVMAVEPFGVDSCTGTNAVDSGRRPIRFKKDHNKVKAFVQEVRRAEKELFSALI